MAVQITAYVQTVRYNGFLKIKINKTLFTWYSKYYRTIQFFPGVTNPHSLENSIALNHLHTAIRRLHIPVVNSSQQIGEQVLKLTTEIQNRTLPYFYFVSIQIVTEMQRFGFYMSSGSLIGLQDIYKYYGSDPVEENEFPPRYPMDMNDPEWIAEHTVVEGRFEPNSWMPHLEVEKMSWMSEPDLFSKHPNSDPDAVLASKESYHSLASLINWQRLLSDMTVVSFFFFSFFFGHFY